MFGPLMAHLRIGRSTGRPRTRPDALRADKAYSSRAIRGHLRSRGVVAIIPEPADQQGHRHRRGSRGGRPPAFDAEAYKGRNVVERRFCDLKQWRGIATRYDKLALTYRAAVVLNAVIAWTRHLSDTP
jgi:transposase